jgi:hypothetical protein
MGINQTTAQDLTESGVYRFQRQLDDACVSRVIARITRPLTPEDIDQMLERAVRS